MTRIAHYIFIPLLSFVSSCYAQSSDAAIQQGIDHILASAHSKADVGIVVQSMRTGAILYQKNASQLLVPASNLKLFTAYAALDRLGPNFKYETQLLTDATQIKNGILDGNVYIKFEGDPEFKLDDLNDMIASLNHLGIHTINGNFIVDNTRYQQEGSSPGTLAEDEHYCYGAPVDALILNRNCVHFTVHPGKRRGEFAQLSFLQHIAMPMKNTVKTSTTRARCGLQLKEDQTARQYELSGCVKRGHPVTLSVAIPDSKRYAENALNALLRQHNITVSGKVNQMTEKAPLRSLTIHYSKPLSELVFDMLKQSDNVIANSLYKQLGFHYFNQRGAWNNGGKAIYGILTEKNAIHLSRLNLVDGSGLSRYNMVTAEQISQLLYAAYHNSYLAESFISALPVSGLNGTLKHRMRSTDVIGKIRAKTGTMRGVSSLSGYVETAHNDILSFSIIVNGHGRTAAVFRNIEDRICRLLRHA